MDPSMHGDQGWYTSSIMLISKHMIFDSIKPKLIWYVLNIWHFIIGQSRFYKIGYQ